MPLSKLAEVMQCEQELRALCAERKSYNEIGSHFGTSRQTILTACRRLKIEKRAKKENKVAHVLQREQELRELLAQNLSYTNIGKHFGTGKTTIISALQKLNIYEPKTPGSWNKKWEAEKSLLLGMLRRGMSCREIGNELGVSRFAIVGACYRLGLRSDEEAKEGARRRRLESKRATQRRSQKRRATTPGKKKPPVQWESLMRAKALESDTRCTIMEIEYGRCHYLDDAGKFYCGAPSEDELGVWCPYHANFVFQRNVGDVGGSPAAASRTGVGTVHNSVGGQVTDRPHQTQEAEAA